MEDIYGHRHTVFVAIYFTHLASDSITIQGKFAGGWTRQKETKIILSNMNTCEA